MAMATTAPSIADSCLAAKRASRTLATLGSEVRDAALEAIAVALEQRTEEILEANAKDLEAARDGDYSAAFLDKLALSERRVDAMIAGVRTIAALSDPVGVVTEGRRLPNGLEVRKVQVPLGVVAVVYEARPNVTIDAAALCLKSGNAVVLRGSSAAARSNAILAEIAISAARDAGLAAGSIGLVAGGREDIAELATQNGLVDLIIPRGGEGLKAALKGVATVPVIYAASGNCHVYVEASAEPESARQIVLNAKLQRPGVCNAAETLLVHADIAPDFLPATLAALADAGVTLHGDDRARAAAPGARMDSASEQDWDTEYLALELAVAVVDGTEQAIEHINAHGSGHSEAIVTRDLAAAQAFQLGVDAACVYVNASTRFTDGQEYGMGAEIGNSTQKLHARGPIGLRELCTYKYLVEGSGQIRPD
ncbi:MAG: glutamate-5-semialdehyde dehydrogenase [Solirubrobacterales bacterium]|nr:glutamate-5-semialdehyde dehydrogenase [Solirubrobacterales bacterium]